MIEIPQPLSVVSEIVGTPRTTLRDWCRAGMPHELVRCPRKRMLTTVAAVLGWRGHRRAGIGSSIDDVKTSGDAEKLRVLHRAAVLGQLPPAVGHYWQQDSTRVVRYTRSKGHNYDR